MSGTSYAAWQRFDVEQELARVDQAEQREERERQQRRREQAKQSVESSATQAAQQSADILAAQAAVAALKAKKKGRARAKRDEAAAEDKAAALQAQAALFAQKGALLQQIMESRRLGDKKLKEESWQEAKTLFETALKATKKLEDLTPELLKAEEEQAKLLGIEAEVSNQHAGEHECEHAEDAEHQCGNTCSHEEHKKKAAKKPDEPLPKANDLKAIIKMFYKDVYMGIGTCDLEEGKLAPATKAFKEVLLRDDVHLAAWLKRGEAFERMGAPLLAMLHFSRITNLDADHELGETSLERVKVALLTAGDAGSDKKAIQQAVSTCTEGRSFKEVLGSIRSVFEEANVLAVENFYDYSTTKYQVVVGCLEALRARPEYSTANDETVTSVLLQIEISCHLNIASGFLEMQRNYSKALRHCEDALRLDGKRTITYFRMGQVYHAMHNYEKALECFATAKTLVPAATATQAEEQHKLMLASIVKETGKCEFDRNQYDIGHLRALATK